MSLISHILYLVMVPGQEAAFDSRASTRPGFQDARRQFGMEAKSSVVQNLDSTARSMHSGSDCISADSSTRAGADPGGGGGGGALGAQAPPSSQVYTYRIHGDLIAQASSLSQKTPHISD